MVELFEANWPIFLIAFLIGLAIAWYILQVRRTTRVKADRRDVLDEGAERARRNQALLDAPARPVTDTASLPRGASEPQPAPLATVSFPLPGSIAGVETVVNATAGTPATISLAEQDELASLRQAETASPDKTTSDDPWRVIPVAESSAVGESTGSDLIRLKGIGPKLALRLNELGIARIDQIAAWDDAEIERIDSELGRFQGRIRRDDWVAQAQLLAAGDQAAYEAKFGRL